MPVMIIELYVIGPVSSGQWRAKVATYESTTTSRDSRLVGGNRLPHGRWQTHNMVPSCGEGLAFVSASGWGSGENVT